MESRISESSETTNESLSDVDVQIAPADERSRVSTTEVFDTEYELVGDLMARYFAAVRLLRYDIEGFYQTGTAEFYDFDPILIATGVEATVLEELPSLVGDSFVKCKVEDYKLFITDLSNGPAHGLGTSEIIRQAGTWAMNSGLATLNDAIVNFGPGSGRAPDLLLGVHSLHLGPGELHRRLAVIELEVGNRSITRMRADFSQYFADPNVVCMIGIKMFVGEGRTPCQRAIAVKWIRTPDGIISDDICDFGILPISTGARASFSRAVEQGLIGVVRARWDTRRFEPVPVAALVPAPPANNQRALVRSVARHVAATPRFLAGTLYGGVSPTFRFEAGLIGILHNLPVGMPAVVDFVFDLGLVFYVIESMGPPV